MKVEGTANLTSQKEMVKALGDAQPAKEKQENPMAAQQVQAAETELSMDEIVNLVDTMNVAVNLFNMNVRFNIISSHQATLIQVIDKNGERVIYQMPPYKLRTIISKLNDTLNGLLVDEKI